MSRTLDPVPLPPTWAGVHGLWHSADGLHGPASVEVGQRIILFEGVRVIIADTFGWGVGAIVACLTTDDRLQILREPEAMTVRRQCSLGNRLEAL